VLRVERRKVSFQTENVGPNGNWMHKGRPFTGVAYTLAPDKTVRSEQEFRDGLRWGPCWERYRSGQLYAESHYYRDVLHGQAREWHENGQLAEDGEYEYGIALWQKKWSEDGTLLEEYKLAEGDSNYAMLQSFRRIYGEAPDAAPGAAANGGA
jgi:antitoxin component YwqK of YwqJK toxin-antitoxin module